MLNSINLNDKTYEEMITEAISQIPLYSSEWTNFNVSDPGITMLQNFTSFHLLQQSYINEVNEVILRKLLKLLHIEADENHAARVLLESRVPDELYLPAHKKLMAGDLCFEPAEAVTVRPWSITAVYSEYLGTFKDITYLLERSIQAGAAVFGTDPQPNTALYCILNDIPDIKRPILLYVQAYNAEKRNPFKTDSKLRFAQVQWQYYTADGWQDVEAEDETHSFLVSGEIRLTLKGAEPSVFTGAPVEGYALRCVLKEAGYDLPPWLDSLTANLFEVVQRDTKAASFSFPGGSNVELKSGLAAYGNVFIYCRENKGEDFRAYTPYIGQKEPGRYYDSMVLEPGTIRIEFDKERFGYGPCSGCGAIRAVCYEEDAVHHRSLGTVYGYENQILDIDTMEHLLPQNFSLIVETRDPDGQSVYSFSKPGETNPDLLCYSLLSEAGQICVTNPGLGEDCRVYLCDCAVSAGSGGNIREENQFHILTADGELSQTICVNPAAGKGGTTYETVEQLRLRFVAEMKEATSAVLASDYEAIVKKAPGLCIHKVKAMVDEGNNIVKITIKPYNEDKLPHLSPLYLEQIRSWLEPRRMITTRVELLQPKYIPINVQATIYVKSYFENARQDIEKLLTSELDYVSSEHDFGEMVRFNEIFRALENLPCVDSVFDLALNPQTRSDAGLVGTDIQLGSHCLCYPGRFSLEINSQARASL